MVSYEAPTSSVRFVSLPFPSEVEITGHIAARLNVSCSPNNGNTPQEIDLFLALWHINKEGQEILYTGSTGNPEPIVRGWLRVSYRAVDASHPYHSEFTPYHPYTRVSVLPVWLSLLWLLYLSSL